MTNCILHRFFTCIERIGGSTGIKHFSSADGFGRWWSFGSLWLKCKFRPYAANPLSWGYCIKTNILYMIINSHNWVISRAFGTKTPTPTHAKIYKVCIYVIVWVSSLFPWLLEGLTAAWALWSPTSRMSGSWMQQEKAFVGAKGFWSPPAWIQAIWRKPSVLLCVSDSVQSQFDSLSVSERVCNLQTHCWDHSAAVGYWLLGK